MMIYPAIDLKDGQCVRLFKGDMERATVFSNTPADQARAFEVAGFRWLHLVDLNGAFEGHSVNAASIEAILEAVDIPVQLGGGIRTLAHIDHWLSKGVARVILGTIAARDPALVREACRAYPGRIAIGIDARAGMVAVEGWADTSSIRATDLAQRYEDCGAAAIIYTDIERDGAMQGPNLAETAALARAISTPVILSGGISTLQDVQAVRQYEADGIEGVIIGRALYEGAISYDEALRA